MDWTNVRTEHVAEACDLIASGKFPPRASARSIFILRGDERLPAKQVLRLAYCMSKGLPLKTYVDFSTGEASVKLLQKLGFEVEHAKRSKPKSPHD